ncbi:hypothetical protein D3C81_1298140 [compost metagenome]
MHAVVDVGDSVHRAVQQQLAALLRLAQADLGGASRAALLEIGQFAIGHQHQALVLALGQGILRAQGQGFGDQVGIVVLHQLDERNVLGLAADAVEGFVRVQ